MNLNDVSKVRRKTIELALYLKQHFLGISDDLATSVALEILEIAHADAKSWNEILPTEKKNAPTQKESSTL